MRRMKAEIAAAKLDALVVVGDDQYELFGDQHMPAIAIYYGETIRNAPQQPVAEGDWYRRAQMRRLEEAGEVHYPCHRHLALHLIDALVEREFDLSALAALSAGQHEGHAYSFVHRWYLKDAPLPIVPVFLNTYNPPNPPLPQRCVKLGAALKDSIAANPEDRRELKDRCIRDAIAMQEAIGLHSITDGEFRRTSFHSDFIGKLDGARSGGSNAPGSGGQFGPRAFEVTDKLKRSRPIELDGFVFLKNETRHTAKQTLL